MVIMEIAKGTGAAAALPIEPVGTHSNGKLAKRRRSPRIIQDLGFRVRARALLLP